MARTYSYADAVKLLGAKESRIVAALDRIVGGALLSGVTMGLTDLLAWFDAKVDFVRLSHELLIKAGERRSGLSRYNQTERAEAAHTVLVVVAFFEALEEMRLPVVWRDLDRDQQLSVTGLTGLFDGAFPLPSPSRPYEVTRRELVKLYYNAAEEFYRLVRNSPVWGRLTRSEQEQIIEANTSWYDHARLRYEELLRTLAGTYPELRFWYQVQDGAATRVALADLERSMNGLLVGRSPDARRAELARKYQALLDRPLIEQEDVLPGLRVPPLRRAYVDPGFQVVSHQPDHAPSVSGWWHDVPVRHDLYHYLTGYLTSSQAVRTPLLVLGDPGSGKSMLTKVLAARLPPSDFLTVRVELRATPAEGDIVDQIQHGLRAALQEDISWAELDRSSGDALPVVLLDGFDELLQATGVNQTRYLAKVQQFQRDRAETGHPVAVVVTSRMSVCAGVYIPPGSDVLRLASFTTEHVWQWLDCWNGANDDYFREADLVPLAATVVMRYRELATQPLLLLMLALYDAAGNALQRVRGRLGEGELYERLLTMFARREVSKDDEQRTEQDLADDTETELERLSVVAFAMFNRGTQWVTETDLSADMAALLEVPGAGRQPSMRSPLSPGAAVLGRFFFVQRSEAVLDDNTLRTYEFLHATFGEYLVARFTWRVLMDTHRVDAARPRRHASTPLDDTELYALLSFAPLTGRRPVLDFLGEFAAGSEDRDALVELVRRLFVEAQLGTPRPDTHYQPVRRGVPTRHAVYSLNLVLVGVVLAHRLHSGWFGVRDWSRLMAFWKSQLTDSEWTAAWPIFTVEWLNDGDVGLRLSTGAVVVPPVHLGQRNLGALSPVGIMVEAHVTADPLLNYLRYPLQRALEDGTHIFLAKMMVDLLFAPVSDREARDTWYRNAVIVDPGIVLAQLRSDPTVPPAILRELAETELCVRPMFWGQLYEQIGKGGPDEELLDIVNVHWPRWQGIMLGALIPMLDAWLRLYEGGHRFPEDREYPDLNQLLHYVDLYALRAVRPDLVVRTERYVSVEPGQPAQQTVILPVGTSPPPSP